MKALLKVLHFGIIGSGIGFLMTSLSLLVNKANALSLKEMLVWCAASFLIGVITMIMYNDRIPLLAATAIHFAGTFSIVVGANFICGIFEFFDSAFSYIKTVFPTFIIIYVIIYAVLFFISKSQEKKINKSLNGEA